MDAVKSIHQFQFTRQNGHGYIWIVQMYANVGQQETNGSAKSNLK